MRLVKFFIIVSFFSFISCSSVEYAQVNASLKGKKIVIAPFDFSATKKKKLNGKDSICFCTGQYASDAITPYFMNAGLTVVSVFHDKKVSYEEFIRAADSLQLDYVLTGKGIVDVVGKSNFLNKLNLSLINIKSKETHFALEYHGAGTELKKGMRIIGNKIKKKLK